MCHIISVIEMKEHQLKITDVYSFLYKYCIFKKKKIRVMLIAKFCVNIAFFECRISLYQTRDHMIFCQTDH